MGYFDHPPEYSVRRWLFTTNHKDVGVLYLITSLYLFVLGGTLALLLRVQLAQPGSNFLPSDQFSQAVTMHGLVMVLWVLSPLASAFANYVLPIQIGAKDLAFPRLNALSYWLYLVSGIMALLGFFTPGGAIATGWTVYAPLNTSRFSPALGTFLGAGGLLLFAASVTISTINFLVTIFQSRAKGLSLMRMPMFPWSMLFTLILMLLVFPSLGTALLMLTADRVLGTVYFSSAEGGAILWDHLFWFFGHPEVYIVLLPALGVIAEILPTFSRRPLFARKYIILALAVGTTLSLIVWVHHMFLTGVNPALRKFMTITTEIISIPFGVIILSFIITMYRGSIRFTTPMLFAVGAIFVFTMGGITGVYNSSVALDYGLRGTYWIVAHFHYVMVGGAITGLIAGLYYWWPKMTGRMYSEKLGKLHFLLYFIGFNVLYFPMHFMLDMPRRVNVYDPALGPLNFLATIGAFIFGPSFLVMFANLFRSLKSGSPAGPNPWDAPGIEWMLDSPPPKENFPGEPRFSPQGTVHFVASQANGASGEPTVHLHESHFSPWPIALGTGAFIAILGVGFGTWLLVGGALLLAVSLVGWGREKFVALEPSGERWPFEGLGRVRLAVWIFLASEIVIFGTLIGAYLYVRHQSAQWPTGLFSTGLGAVNTIVLLSSGLTLALALLDMKTGGRRGFRAGLIATFLLGSAFLIIKGIDWVELFQHHFTFTSGIAATAFYVTTGAHGGHVAVGLLALLYLIVRSFQGSYTAQNHESVELFALYWAFVDIVWMFLFPLFYLI